MERIEGARTPYEVYCFHCRVTFPPEARSCLHCGGPLYGPNERAAVGMPVARGAAPPLPIGGEGDDAAGQAVRRFGGLAIWALVALSAVLSNLCHRG